MIIVVSGGRRTRDPVGRLRAIPIIVIAGSGGRQPQQSPSIERSRQPLKPFR